MSPQAILFAAAVALAAGGAVVTFRRDAFNPPWAAAGVALLRAGALLLLALLLAQGGTPGAGGRAGGGPRTLVLAEQEAFADPARRADLAAGLRPEVAAGRPLGLLAWVGDGAAPSATVGRLTWQGEPLPLLSSLASARLTADWEAAAAPGTRTVELAPSPPLPVLAGAAFPREGFAGASLPVRLSLPDLAAPVTLRLFTDGRPVAAQVIAPGTGARRDATAAFSTTFAAPGPHRIRLEARDPGNRTLDLQGGTITIAQRPRVTFISGSVVSGSVPPPPLAGVWAAAGFPLRLLPPSALADDPSLLARAAGGDLIVLDNVPPHLLAARERELAEAVGRRGASLLFIPGNEVWAAEIGRSPLAALLPVRFGGEPQDKDQTLALVAVVDTSFSMYFPMPGDDPTPKMEMAKAALLDLVRAVPDRDRLGILGVDLSPYWVASPTQARDRLREENAVRRLTAFSGGINIYSGLLAAWQELQKVTADHRHILVLADTSDIDEVMVTGKGNVWDLTRRMAQEGVTVSIIGFGQSTDSQVATLSRLAEEGGGFLYVVSRPKELPALFLKDLERVAERLPVDRGVRVFFPPPDFPTLDRLPMAAGQIRASPRAGASLWAWSEEGHALLAGWRVGRGAVGVFASDSGRSLAGGWAAPDAGPLWELVLAKLEARPADDDERFIALRTPEGVSVSLRSDGSIAPAEAPPKALVTFVRPGGGSAAQGAPLRETGPGEYSAFLPLPAGERALLTVAGPRGDATELDLPGPPPQSGPAPAAAREKGELPGKDRPPRSPRPPLFPFEALPLLALSVAGLLALDELFRGP